MDIIGIDSGSSTVKIVELNENKQVVHKVVLKKMPVMQAVDVFINKEKIDKENIEKYILTGVGKDEVKNKIYEKPVIKVNEFTAIGTGGLSLTKQKKALVVSIGTGTAFVKANRNKHTHIGGTGVGRRDNTKFM